MRSAFSKVLILLFVAAAGAIAHGQVNPHTQIRWPANCRTGDGKIYNWTTNQCQDLNNINPGTQLGWPASCTAGMVYDASINNCMYSMTSISPGTQLNWPVTCNTGSQVYSPALNACVTNGTAANPAGSNGQMQYNRLGGFAASPSLTFDGSGNVVNLTASGAVSVPSVNGVSYTGSGSGQAVAFPGSIAVSNLNGITYTGSGSSQVVAFPGSIGASKVSFAASGSAAGMTQPPTNTGNVYWNSCFQNAFAVDPVCGPTGLGYMGPFTLVVISNPTVGVNQDTYYGSQVQLNAVTGGVNTASHKSNFDAFIWGVRSWTPGQHCGICGFDTNGSDGDTFGIAGYSYGFGNTNAAGDEGHIGIAGYAYQGNGQGTLADSEFSATISTVAGNVLNYTGGSASEPYARGEGRLVIDQTTGVYSTGTITAISGTPPTITGSGTTWTSLGSGSVSNLCFSLDSGNGTNSLLYVLKVNSIVSDTSITLLNSNSNGNLAWAGDATTGTYKLFKCSTVTAVAKTGAVTVADGTQFHNGDAMRMPLGNALSTTGGKAVTSHFIPGGTNVGFQIAQLSGSRPWNQAIAISGNASILFQHAVSTLSAYTVFSDQGAANVFATFSALTNQIFTILSLNRPVSGGTYTETYDPSTDLRRFLGAGFFRFQGLDATHARFDVDTSGGIPTFYCDSGVSPAQCSINNSSMFYTKSGNTSTNSLSINAANGVIQQNPQGTAFTASTLTSALTCNATNRGAYSFITDGAASPVYMATMAGGGSTVTPVFCNGTNWVNH